MIEIAKFIKKYDEEYDFLYEHYDRVAGYNEAVRWYDENHTKPEVKVYVEAYMKEVDDFISSDREAAAFAFACETFGIGE